MKANVSSYFRGTWRLEKWARGQKDALTSFSTNVASRSDWGCTGQLPGVTDDTAPLPCLNTVYSLVPVFVLEKQHAATPELD